MLKKQTDSLACKIIITTYLPLIITKPYRKYYG